MKRPFAVLGFTYLTALMVALFVGSNIAYILSGVLAVLFVISLFVKKLRKRIALPFIFITSAVAMLMFSTFVEQKLKTFEVLSGTEQRITATVCDEVYESNGKYYYPLEVKKIRNLELSGFKILASSSVLYDVDVYDELDAKISLYQNADSVFGNYDISKGYFLRGAIKHYSGVVTEKAYEKPFYYNFILLRRNIKSVIAEYLPQDCANLLTAVMLGDKHSFTTEEKEMFSSAGVSHLMSVSGFHVTIVAQLFMLIFAVVFRRKRIGAGISVLALLVFMAVTGFSPTVVRSGIMQIIFLIGLMIFRSPEPFNSLGFSVLLICFLNPYSCADFGFLMSVGATFGIFCASERIKTNIIERLQQKKPRRFKKLSLRRIIPKKKAEKFVSSIVSVIAMTISATVFTLPVTLIVFKQFPIYSVISNLLISYPASIMIACGIIAVLFNFSGILSFLTVPIMFVCELIAKYIMFWTEAIANLPFSVIRLNYSFVPFWLAIVILAYFIVRKLKNRRFAVKFTMISGIATLVLMILAYDFYMVTGISVYIADCNNGINIAVSSSENNSMVTYGGSKAYDLFEYLETRKISEFEYLMITIPSSYYSKNADEILQDYSVNNIGIYDIEKADENLLSLAETKGRIIEYKSDIQNNVSLPDYKITSIETKSGVFTHFTFSGDFDILVIPNGGDCLEMPREWLNSAICVMSELPENYELLRPAEIILSCSDENVYEPYSNLESICDTIYATCFDDNIRMRISQSGEVSIWSENNWLF